MCNAKSNQNNEVEILQSQVEGLKLSILILIETIAEHDREIRSGSELTEGIKQKYMKNASILCGMR